MTRLTWYMYMPSIISEAKLTSMVSARPNNLFQLFIILRGVILRQPNNIHNLSVINPAMRKTLDRCISENYRTAYWVAALTSTILYSIKSKPYGSSHLIVVYSQHYVGNFIDGAAVTQLKVRIGQQMFLWLDKRCKIHYRQCRRGLFTLGTCL